MTSAVVAKRIPKRSFMMLLMGEETQYSELSERYGQVGCLEDSQEAQNFLCSKHSNDNRGPRQNRKNEIKRIRKIT